MSPSGIMTPMTNGVDVRTAAAEFDRSAVADAASAAEEERKQVLSQFPLEDWAELPLERYALGQAAPPGAGPTYCRLMEFGTPHLGSIKGGSAAKHIMYHHVSGEWRLAAPCVGWTHRTPGRNCADSSSGLSAPSSQGTSRRWTTSKYCDTDRRW